MSTVQADQNLVDAGIWKCSKVGKHLKTVIFCVFVIGPTEAVFSPTTDGESWKYTGRKSAYKLINSSITCKMLVH